MVCASGHNRDGLYFESQLLFWKFMIGTGGRFYLRRVLWGTAKGRNLVDFINSWLVKPFIPVVLFHEWGYLSFFLDDRIHPQKVYTCGFYCMVYCYDVGLKNNLALWAMTSDQSLEWAHFHTLLVVLSAFILQLWRCKLPEICTTLGLLACRTKPAEVTLWRCFTQAPCRKERWSLEAMIWSCDLDIVSRIRRAAFTMHLLLGLGWLRWLMLAIISFTYVVEYV